MHGCDWAAFIGNGRPEWVIRLAGSVPRGDPASLCCLLLRAGNLHETYPAQLTG